MSIEALGMPRVIIEFKRRALVAAQSGDGGVVVLAMRDEVTDVTKLTAVKAAEAEKLPLSAKNMGYIKQALLGGCRAAIALVIPKAAPDWTAAFEVLESMRFTACAFPGIAAAEVAAVVTWVKGMADGGGDGRLVVLPHADTAAHPWIVNFATDDILLDGADTRIPATEYTARVVGAIAGIALARSITYLPLIEVVDVPHMALDEADAAIKAGKLILLNDGEKVKFARGVTSLINVSDIAPYAPEWRKIQVVRVLNLIREDIRRTIEDTYIGKIQNDTTHRGMLISEINDYLAALVNQNVLQPSDGDNTVSLDIDKTREYLKTLLSAKDVDAMSDDEIANTNMGDSVYLKGVVKPLGCIESVDLTFTV